MALEANLLSFIENLVCERLSQNASRLPMDDFYPMLDTEFKLNKRKDVSERTIEGETLILDRTNGRVHHLNSTASYIWRHCDGLSTKAIAKQLAEAFQVDAAIAEPDVVALLGEMRTMNLLET